MGVHGRYVQGKQLLNIGFVEFALVDGDRHGGGPNGVTGMRRGEGLTASSGTHRFATAAT
jgi:hypothetical protein